MLFWYLTIQFKINRNRKYPVFIYLKNCSCNLLFWFNPIITEVGGGGMLVVKVGPDTQLSAPGGRGGGGVSDQGKFEDRELEKFSTKSIPLTRKRSAQVRFF